MHFLRDSGVSPVLESSCITHTLRFCARCFLALTQKSLFLDVPFSLMRIFTRMNLGLLLIWSLPVFAETGKNTQGPLISEPVGAGDFFQMFLGLLLVLGIIFGMAWFIRRMGTFQQASHGALRILGGLSVGQRERIVLVQVGDKQLLLGLAPGHIRTLHVLEHAVVMNEQNSKSMMSFADRLQSVIQGRSKQ